MKNCHCEPAGGPLYCPVHNPREAFEGGANQLREAFSQVGTSAKAAADSLLAYGRALARPQIAELFKRYEASQRAARRRRRRHDR